MKINLLIKYKQTPHVLQRSLVKPIRISNKIWQLFYLNRNRTFKNEKKYIPNNIKIDIIIPVIEKDLNILPFTIKGIRKNVIHPIENIKIIAPKSDKIRRFCKRHQCIYINEDRVLPIKKVNISYIENKIDRSGWIWQQFIKLSEHLSSCEYYLVVDADTVLIRPQVFIRETKTLILIGDDYYPPYYKMYESLFGYKRNSNNSFVCHQMLFSKKRVFELKKEIEFHTNQSWYEAIINRLHSLNNISLSEYEIYGNWMLKNHGDKIVNEYWFNKTMSQKEIKNYSKFQEKYKISYKSISFQHYI